MTPLLQFHSHFHVVYPFSQMRFWQVMSESLWLW